MACKFTGGGGSSHDENGIPYNIGTKQFGNGVYIDDSLRDYLKKQQDRIDELEKKVNGI